jgi:alpha/beta superfamily hydrolase
MLDTIHNRQKEQIDYSLHEPRDDSGNIVVIGHGVTGNKDRSFVVALAESLAAAGILVLRISFSGNGDSGGTFGESTISKEVEDLGAVIDALDGRSVSLVGHSMGAAVGVLRTSQDSRIQHLVSLAGMVHTDAFAQTEFGDVTPDEGCMWGEPSCPLSQVYMDDMKSIGTVVDRGSEITVPWLLVHGTEDDVVPLQDSLDIYERATEPKQLAQIDEADHVFSEHTPEMVEIVTRWFVDQGLTR